MATIKQIAEAVGVSSATVSRVLNKDETLGVSAEVRDKIFAVSHKLGYIPTRLRKISLAEGITIGVADWHILPPEATNAMLDEFQRMAKQYCKTPVQFCSLALGQAKKVDGILALGRFSEDEVAFLKQQSFSILFLDSNQKNYTFDRVMIDHYSGLKEAIADYKAKGKTRFAAMSGIYQKDGVTIGKMRTRTFREMLQHEQLAAQEDILIGEMTAQSGYAMAQQLLQRAQLPEVLLIGSEIIASGALDAFASAGKAVPNDIEVVVYQDILTQQKQSQLLPVICAYTDAMWKMVIRTLMERISSKPEEYVTLLYPSRYQNNQLG